MLILAFLGENKSSYFNNINLNGD